MRIIYSEGFHLDERKEIRQVIFSNMVVAFKIIAEEMRDLGQDYQNSNSEVTKSFLLTQSLLLTCSKEHEKIIAAAEDIGPEDQFPQRCLPAMKALWNDPSVQQTIKRGNEFALHDNIQ